MFHLQEISTFLKSALLNKAKTILFQNEVGVPTSKLAQNFAHLEKVKIEKIDSNKHHSENYHISLA